jgi:hypothetical protein
MSRSRFSSISSEMRSQAGLASAISNVPPKLPSPGSGNFLKTMPMDARMGSISSLVPKPTWCLISIGRPSYFNLSCSVVP